MQKRTIDFFLRKNNTFFTNEIFKMKQNEIFIILNGENFQKMTEDFTKYFKKIAK